MHVSVYLSVSHIHGCGVSVSRDQYQKGRSVGSRISGSTVDFVDLYTGCSTTGANAIVHFGSVGRLQGLFERSKAHPARG